MTPLDLGFALLPSAETERAVFDLVTTAKTCRPLSYFLSPGTAVPHVSLWQGRYDPVSLPEIFEFLQSLHPGVIPATQAMRGCSIWAQRILFLDLEKSPALVELQNTLVNHLLPLSLPGSADPQSFRGIDSQQAASLASTGYPFTERRFGAFAPHFTIAHLAEPIESPVDRASCIEQLASWSHANRTAEFAELCIFRVLPLGRLDESEIIFRRSL
jgi:hypothetical protein